MRRLALAVAALAALATLLAGARLGAQMVGATPPPPGPAAYADTSAAAGLHVYLVTFGQGDLVWEKFGHNAIRVFDERTGSDAEYNWGIFDFRQPRFLQRFLVGEPLYSSEAFPSVPFNDFYAEHDRATWQQELALPAAQRLALRDFVEWNARPENKLYRYDYFRDNCSTRARDALDRAMGGLLHAALRDTTELTYRSESLRLMGRDALPYAGMDVALGEPADRRLTRWEAAFIPMRLMEYARTVKVPDGRGGVRPLVLEERTLYTPRRAAELAAPPRTLGWFLLGGLLVAALITWLGQRASAERTGARRGLAAVGALLAFVAGLFGVVLTLAWALTNHFAWYRNENLFQFNPIALFLVAALPLALRRAAGTRARAAALRLTTALAGLSLLGFVLQALPGIDQSNGHVIALMLPVHLATAWAVRRALVRREGRDGPLAP